VCVNKLEHGSVRVVRTIFYGANTVALSEETESNGENKPAPKGREAHFYSIYLYAIQASETYFFGYLPHLFFLEKVLRGTADASAESLAAGLKNGYFHPIMPPYI